MAVLVGYYLFTLILLRISFSSRRLPIRLLLISLVAAQLALKLIDRYYFPFYPQRALDENFWLPALASYQKTGQIAIAELAQGPGIYYLVSATGYIFHIDFGSALIGLGIVFGSLYVVPAYWLYHVFFAGDQRLAFVGTLLLSMSDVMIYSTTVARPTLFGLFLIPLAVGAFQLLRGKFQWRMFGLLVLFSIMILFMHAPITFVVLLAIVSFAVLIFDRARKWEAAYVILLFLSYGLMIRFFLRDLNRIWEMELFGSYPLNLISSIAGENFFLVFPVMGLGLLVVSRLLGKIGKEIRKREALPTLKSSNVWFLVLAALVLLAALGSVAVFWKYDPYIAQEYRGWGFFLLLHSWKIMFGVVGLLGLWKIGTRFRRTSNDVALAWIFCLVVIVVGLATYAPLIRYPGLWDIDERFAEFAYYPAVYFVTLGLNYIRGRLSGRIFGSIFLPLFALYIIPSIIVGTRIHTILLHSLL